MSHVCSSWFCWTCCCLFKKLGLFEQRFIRGPVVLAGGFWWRGCPKAALRKEMTGVFPMSTCEIGLGSRYWKPIKFLNMFFFRMHQHAAKTNKWYQKCTKRPKNVDDLFMQNNTLLYHEMSRGDSNPLANNQGVGTTHLFSCNIRGSSLHDLTIDYMLVMLCIAYVLVFMFVSFPSVVTSVHTPDFFLWMDFKFWFHFNAFHYNFI